MTRLQCDNPGTIPDPMVGTCVKTMYNPGYALAYLAEFNIRYTGIDKKKKKKSSKLIQLFRAIILHFVSSGRGVNDFNSMC